MNCSKLQREPPPFMVLKLLNMKKGNVIQESLRRVADDLDFSQTVASLTCRSGKINSLKNAVAAAFSKRNANGQFQLGQSLYVDKLINENESREVDEDEKVPPRRKRWGSRAENSEKQVRYFCYDYQQGKCARSVCRYPHICKICWKNHGAVDCPDTPGGITKGRKKNPVNVTGGQDDSHRRAKIPPHPRYRREKGATHT